MEVYKTRLIKTIYNVYLIKSDIEGATVIFDGEEVGTIQNGSFTYQLPQKTDLADSHTISIKENTGTLYQKPIDYIFSTIYTEEDRYQVSNLQNSITLEVGGEGNITSIKTTYTQSYPSHVVVENISQDIELNTVQTPSSELVGITGNLLDVQVNHTTNPIQGEIEITQDESGNKMNFPYEQAAGVQTPFTVNSDIEGATVTISNGNTISKQGTISQGSCQILFWQDEWEEGSMTAQVSGDSSLLKPEEETYTFSNNTEDPVVFQGVGGDFLIEDYWTIISTYGNTTYSYPSLSSIGTSHSITLNQIPYSETGQQIEYSPTELNLSPVTSEINSSITITQNGSNKTLSLPYKQLSMSLHTYTVFSDIEGGRVQFGDLGTDIISNGKASISVWDNRVQDLVLITITEGTLVTKETEYVFEQTETIPTVSANGGSANFNSYIESNKTVYTSNYPSSGYLAKDSSVTLNTVISSTTEDVSFTPNGVSYQGNETTSTKSELVLITQSESGKTLNIQVTQAAGTSYTYTVSSDIEGATVNFSNGESGTIENGRFILTLWNDKAPDSLNFTLSGGTVNSPGEWEYEFDITTLGGTSLGSSDTYNASGEGVSNLATGGTSRKRRIEYSVPTSSFTVSRNGSRTANQVGNYTSYTTLSYSITSVSQSWISYNSSNQITASRNSTTSTRTGTITYTQSESGNTDVVTISQVRGLYTYTINSNCNGGTVYFNNTRVGTVSNGACTFQRQESSGTVSISGGVPSNTSSNVNTGYDYDTDRDTRTTSGGSSSTTEFEFSGRGTDWDRDDTYGIEDSGSSTVDVTIISTTRTTTTTNYQERTVYLRRYHWQVRTTTYTGPSAKTVNGDSSATMNYTSSTSTGSTQYDDWEEYDYGSWSTYDTDTSTTTKGVTPTIGTRTNCSCSLSSSNSSTGSYTYRITISSNSSTSNRSYSCTFTRSGESSIRVYGTQWHRDYSTLEFYGGGTSKSLTISGDYGDVNENLLTAVSLLHTKGQELYTAFGVSSKSSWLNVGGYEDAGNYNGINGAALIKFGATGSNPSTSSRSGSITFKQTYYDQKTITINVTQRGASNQVTFEYVGGAKEYTYNWGSRTHGTRNNIVQILSDVNGTAKTPTVSGTDSGMSVSITKAANTVNRYNVSVTLSQDNTGTSTRSYDATIAQSGSPGVQLGLRVNQPAT